MRYTKKNFHTYQANVYNELKYLTGKDYTGYFKDHTFDWFFDTDIKPVWCAMTLLKDLKRKVGI